MRYKLLQGNCLEIMQELAEASVDAIVTDPPYGLEFMGKSWDQCVPGVEYWQEALKVAKPGAHLLCFGGTRTFHRMTCAIEDAGWEIRDCIMWVYGSGFPKSMDVAKAIDVRECSDTAKEWQGWGTALKPAWEPIIVARKPLESTIVDAVLKYGTGAINIDGCRIGTEAITTCGGNKFPKIYGNYKACKESIHSGRFPANLCHDGSEEVLALFPDVGTSTPCHQYRSTKPCNTFNGFKQNKEDSPIVGYTDSGSAARFFYCAKASNADRGADNNHPTVKPNDLMRWLVRLVCRPGGTVLDPFMGSGSTGVACKDEGLQFIGIELDEHYLEIANKRINDRQETLFSLMEAN